MKTETREKPKLEVGKEYEIELYPGEEKKKAKYLGILGKDHFFRFTGDKRIEDEREYIIMDDQWLTEDDGSLSYLEISSKPVFSFTVSDMNSKLDHGKREVLTYNLRQLGEDI